MSVHYEVVFCQHLCLPESLAEIVQMVLPEELLPTEALRPIHLFALDYWHAESTKGIAPTPAVLRVHFDNLLAEHEIDLDIDPEGTLSWAIEALRGNHIDRQWQPFVRKFATEMATADVMAKPDVLTSAIDDLMNIASALTVPHEQVELRIGIGQALDRYDARVALRSSGRSSTGAIFGFPEVDEHIIEVRPSELCLIGGTPKAGKSYMALQIGRACWNNGGTPVIITLENSVEETTDRAACMFMAVDYGRWQRGECDEDDVQRIRDWHDYMEKHQRDRPFHIIQPGIGERTMEHLVRKAKSMGDVVIIDQLTFVEANPLHVRLPRYQQIGFSLHELKSLLGSGKRIPGFLMHQVSREGQKQAEKLGRLEMYHMADAAEVERTPDWVFGMFATLSMVDSSFVYLQMLAARRQRLLSWQLVWRPWIGQMAVSHAVRLDGR